MGSEVIWVVLIPVATIGFIILMRRVGKNMVSTSPADQEKIDRLTTSGERARATLTAIVPTGLTVNNFNVQCEVHFWIEPLSGAAPFEASKKMFFLETQFPRQGDTWPAWFDRTDPSTFAVGAPGKLDPAQIPLYREFGIEHPLDD